jgi:hypothetical protein
MAAGSAQHVVWITKTPVMPQIKVPAKTDRCLR